MSGVACRVGVVYVVAVYGVVVGCVVVYGVGGVVV